MGVRLEALRRQHIEITSGIDKIEAKAVAEGRDLNDVEKGEADALYARSKTLAPEIANEAEKQGSIDAAAAVLAKFGGGTGGAVLQRSADKPAEPELTPGEYMSLMVRSRRGDTEAAELLTRTVAQQTTADNAGLLPKPIIGQVIKLADDRRQVFGSFSAQPMPGAGKTFTRPRITQRVLVAEQAAELDELASRKMTVTGTDVTKRTFGGTLELSRQDIDWTDPSVLNLVVNDFAGYYSRVTDIAATVALTTAAAATSPWTTTNIGTMISSFTTAIGVVAAATEEMPDTIWLSVDQALSLAGNTNSTTNVSALTLIKQTLNEADQKINFVVSPRLPSGTRIVGNSKLIESYEMQLGLLSMQNITHLGLDVAYAGYIAFFAIAAGFVTVVTP